MRCRLRKEQNGLCHSRLEMDFECSFILKLQSNRKLLQQGENAKFFCLLAGHFSSDRTFKIAITVSYLYSDCAVIAPSIWKEPKSSHTGRSSGAASPASSFQQWFHTGKPTSGVFRPQPLLIDYSPAAGSQRDSASPLESPTLLCAFSALCTVLYFIALLSHLFFLN